MQTKTKGRRRSGMAPLEFVLVLPLLSALLYLMFAVAKDTISKCTVIEKARYETWKKIPSANPMKPLALRTSVQDGEIHHDAARSITHTGALNQTFSVESKNRTTAQTWDSKLVPFVKQSQPFLAHLAPLQKIAADAPGVGVMVGMLKVAATAMNVPANPAIAALGAASGALATVVEVEGVYLKYVAKPIMEVTLIAATIELIIAIETFQWEYAAFLVEVIDLLRKGISSCDQMYEAGYGRKTRI